MGETNHDGLAIPGRAILAHEPEFSLGPVRVNPPTRQVIIGTRQYTIEPRVMQVLSVLAKAHGGVVSREELIDRCWDGRIVGDDAINHAIGKLRQLAAASDGAFAIETIARVGYRLIENGKPAGLGESTAGATNRARAATTRRIVIGSGIALGAVALGGASMRFLPLSHQPSPLAKMYYERGVVFRGQGYSTDPGQAVGYFRRAVQIDPQ